MADNRRLKGRSQLEAGIGIAASGAALRGAGSAAIRTGNDRMRTASQGVKPSTFGPGAAKEAQSRISSGRKMVRTGAALRRASKLAPVVGGGVAGVGAYRMAQDYRSRKNAVAKKDGGWSDEKFNRRKKLQGALSTAGGTLGVSALGSMAATRLGGPKAGAAARKVGDAARKVAVPLSVASTGVGGVGSFNFAGISNEEARRAMSEKQRFRSLESKVRRVSKMDVPRGLTSPVTGIPNTKKLATQSLTGKNRLDHQKQRLTAVSKISQEDKRLRRADRYQQGLDFAAAGGTGYALGGAAGRAAAPTVRAGISGAQRGMSIARQTGGSPLIQAREAARGIGPGIRQSAPSLGQGLRRAGRAAARVPKLDRGVAAGAAGAALASYGLKRHMEGSGQPYRPLPRELR